MAARTARAHTGAFTARSHKPSCRPVRPQPQTERSVLGPESGPRRISCNNWQVGLLASGFRFSRGS